MNVIRNGLTEQDRALIETWDQARADGYLATLRANWPMWNESQRYPYVSRERIVEMLDAPSWDFIQPEMARLQRQGKLRNVTSSGLNQVSLRWED